MTIYSGYVAASADDYSDASGSTATVILASYKDELDPTPDQYSYGYVAITTGEVSGATINSATLYWYDQEYIKAPKDETYNGNINIWNGSSWGSPIYTFTTAPGTGWKSHGLTAGELASINAYGGNKTRFLFTVDAVTQVGGSRYWRVRTYDYAPTGTFSPYLVIDYTLPSGGGISIKKKFILIG